MAYLKFKACRRLGENIWHNKKLTPKQNTIIKLVIKKNTSRKQSDFSKKLQQLKKLAYFYGMRSLNNRATSSADPKGAASRLDKKKSLLLTLETRLDVILVRLYFCSTLFAARQLITHNKIRVNLNVVNLPGFTVRKGDIISIADDREAVTVRATARLRLVDLVSKIKAPAKAAFGQRGPTSLGGLSGALAAWSSSGRPKGPTGASRRFRSAPYGGGAPDVDREPVTRRIPKGAVSGGALANRQKISVRALEANGPFVAIRERPFTGVGGPLVNFEVNYKTFNAVLLYEPIQIHFPYKIDLDLLF